MDFDFDKRLELFLLEGKYYNSGGDFYIHGEKGKSAPIKIPTPNIPSLYLNISDNALKNAKEINENILLPSITLNHDSNSFEYKEKYYYKHIFDMYENLFVSIVFNYAAVESITNNLIPNSCSVRWNTKTGESTVGKDWIEKNVTLEDKIKKVIPKIYNLKIKFGKLNFWKNFKLLEHHRNEIIHFKSDEFIDDTIKVAPYLSEFFVDIMKHNIIESGREIIKYLCIKIPNIQGLPHEFHSEPYKLTEKLKHFSKKKS